VTGKKHLSTLNFVYKNSDTLFFLAYLQIQMHRRIQVKILICAHHFRRKGMKKKDKRNKVKVNILNF
jgi:hypothetical protein